jgi:malate dehydrogenase (oxaloacetate-decarboxylating)
MVRDAHSERQATGQIWIVDLPGLLTDDMSQGMLDYQRPYARPVAEAAGWDKTPVPVDPSAATRWPRMAALRQERAAAGIITLQTVVEQVKPTILIGTSTTQGAFTQQVIEARSSTASCGRARWSASKRAGTCRTRLRSRCGRGGAGRGPHHRMAA